MIDLILAFVVLFAAMLVVLIFGASLIIPMAVGLIAFICVGLHRKFTLPDLLRMAFQGAKPSFVVIAVLLLIGGLTGLWRASGTVACFVYYGIQGIIPSLFIVMCFLLCALISYALGTSFGVAATVGVSLMMIARASGANTVLTAGAILSGLYFGDRSSPTSSCANLTAILTKTDIFANVRRMLRTIIGPFVICTLLYTTLSLLFPVQNSDLSVLRLFETEYNLSLWCLIPAVFILFLPLVKVPVKWSIAISACSAFVLSIVLQGSSFLQTVRFLFLGYSARTSEIATMVNGGGVISMVEICSIVVLSSSYAGIFDGTHVLDGLREQLTRLANRIGLFETTVLTGLIAVMAFCNQTIGIIFTNQMVGHIYRDRKLSDQQLAMDISDSVVVFAPLIPWSISFTVPATMLGSDIRSLPFAFLLYLLPLYHAIVYRISENRKRSETVKTKS